MAQRRRSAARAVWYAALWGSSGARSPRASTTRSTTAVARARSGVWSAPRSIEPSLDCQGLISSTAALSRGQEGWSITRSDGETRPPEPIRTRTSVISHPPRENLALCHRKRARISTARRGAGKSPAPLHPHRSFSRDSPSEPGMNITRTNRGSLPSRGRDHRPGGVKGGAPASGAAGRRNTTSRARPRPFPHPRRRLGCALPARGTRTPPGDPYGDPLSTEASTR